MADMGQGYERLMADPDMQVRFPAAVTHLPDLPSGPSMLASAGGLFWVVVAVILGALAVVAVQAVRGGRLRVPQAGPAGRAAVADAVALPVAALRDADALAAIGRYGDAVHALLLRGVSVIQDRFPGALGPSHTSRDIAGLDELPPALRTAFAGIAARTEQAVFAQAPLGIGDWRASRALYAGLLPQRDRA